MANKEYDTPKRYTALNDITGALIKSKGTNQEEYSSGWDAIWGKKTITDVQEILDSPSIIVPDNLSREETINFIKAKAYQEATREEFARQFNDSGNDEITGVMAGSMDDCCDDTCQYCDKSSW